MAEHPFAHFIRTLGKGKQGMRNLSQEEAGTAMRMMLMDEVEPVQLGAFLMLMRVKEETPEEVAGFVAAIRDWLPPRPDVHVDLDWSSYAGKRRQQPWFVLSALLLAGAGVKVFMHGLSRPDDRLYTPQVLSQLGIPVVDTFEGAARSLESRNFAFMELRSFAPKLHGFVEMRDLLGLRSPIHTVARMINPLNAAVMLQGIFHPGYRDMHQEAGALLGQPHLAVIKGDGGEIERDPDSPCVVKSVHESVLSSEEWPAMFQQRHVKPECLSATVLADLWEGRFADEYGEASVIGTAAIALRALGRASSQQDALAQATSLWQNRGQLPRGH